MNKFLVLWDLDGTLCLHNQAFHEEAPRAVAAAALSVGIPLHTREALEFARANYPGQKTAIQAFAKRFALDAEHLFQLYYQQLEPVFLSPDAAFINLVRKSQSALLHGVFTQAPELWIHKALGKLGLLSCFDESWLLGYERLGQTQKNSAANRTALAAALSQSGYSPDRVAIVDDRDFILAQLAELASIRICLGSDGGTVPGLLAAPSPLAAIELIVAKLPQISLHENN